MNQYQQLLFNDLEFLIQNNEAFYRQEFVKDERKYVIYNYRLASYTDFLAPGAIEARGTTFELNGEGKAVRLVALPMHKFFNRFENPSTMDVDITAIESIEDKSDGSLISSYMHHGQVFLKTKGSLFSDQAVAAMYWLDQPEQAEFKRLVTEYTMELYTVNMEWVSPENRIVLGYLEPRLIVLNVRDTMNGTYNTFHANAFKAYMAPDVDLKGLSLIDFVNQIPDMQEDIEGYIVKMKGGLWMKIKTKKYLALHHCKDSVNNPRRLWEVIVNEGIDDIRAMFHEDALLIRQIDEMQTKVDHVYNHMINIVETFYGENKHLERKDYAIKAQATVDKLYFSLVMNLYLEKPVNYKQFLISKYKNFGIRDIEQEE